MAKIPCQICNVKGTLQKVGNNYYRIRHYQGSFNKKLRFHYHQNTKEYALKHLEKLRQQNMLVNTIFDQNPKNNKVNIDLKEHKQHSKQANIRASSSARIGLTLLSFNKSLTKPITTLIGLLLEHG